MLFFEGHFNFQADLCLSLRFSVPDLIVDLLEDGGSHFSCFEIHARPIFMVYDRSGVFTRLEKSGVFPPLI